MFDELVERYHREQQVDGPFLREVDEALLQRVARALWQEEKISGLPAKIRYYHSDHLGGTTHVINSTGGLVASSQYLPYGLLANKMGEQPVFGFTGAERDEESDELGLTRMGARWYAAALGRWVSADPLFLENANKGVEFALQSGLYAYSGNNPINNKDSSGFILDTIADVGFLVYDVISLGYHLVKGDTQAAKIDAAALAADAVCTLAPVATGGGAAVRAAKEGAKRLVTKEGLKQVSKQAVHELVHGVPQVAREGGEQLLFSGSKKATQAEIKAQQIKSKTVQVPEVINKIPNSELKYKPKKRGSAPIGEDNRPIELHHVDQSLGNASPRKEMTRTDHRGKGNYKENHTNIGKEPSTIDRVESSRQHKSIWENEWDAGRFDELLEQPQSIPDGG